MKRMLSILLLGVCLITVDENMKFVPQLADK